MAEKTRANGNVTTNATVTDAERQAGLVALVAEHADAIAIGMRLREERDQRNAQAKSLMSRPDALQKLGAIISYLDDAVYSECLDIRQAEAHRVAVNLMAAIEDALTCETGSADYARAMTDVQAHVALLVQRGPSSVRSNPELTFALQGYVSMLRGMRGVALPIEHTTPSDKLAAIRAQEQKRAQRHMDAVNALKALMPATTVDAD